MLFGLWFLVLVCWCVTIPVIGFRCTGLSNECGWCPSTGWCVAVNSSNPFVVASGSSCSFLYSNNGTVCPPRKYELQTCYHLTSTSPLHLYLYLTHHIVLFRLLYRYVLACNSKNGLGCAACTAFSPLCVYCETSQACQYTLNGRVPTLGATCYNTFKHPNGVPCDSPDCGSKTNCKTCIEFNSTCGWCGSTGRCVATNATNPVAPLSGNSVCGSGFYAANGTACPIVCSDYSNQGCAACTQFPQCGYCEETGSCSTASSNGLAPAGGSCYATYRNSKPGAVNCTAINCGAATSCSTCRALSNQCGWCANWNRCVSADPSLPYQVKTGGAVCNSNDFYNANGYSCPVGMCGVWFGGVAFCSADHCVLV